MMPNTPRPASSKVPRNLNMAAMQTAFSQCWDGIQGMDEPCSSSAVSTMSTFGTDLKLYERRGRIVPPVSPPCEPFALLPPAVIVPMSLRATPAAPGFGSAVHTEEDTESRSTLQLPSRATPGLPFRTPIKQSRPAQHVDLLRSPHSSSLRSTAQLFTELRLSPALGFIGAAPPSPPMTPSSESNDQFDDLSGLDGPALPEH